MVDTYGHLFKPPGNGAFAVQSVCVAVLGIQTQDVYVPDDARFPVDAGLSMATCSNSSPVNSTACSFFSSVFSSGTLSSFFSCASQKVPGTDQARFSGFTRFNCQHGSDSLVQTGKPPEVLLCVAVVSRRRLLDGGKRADDDRLAYDYDPGTKQCSPLTWTPLYPLLLSRCAGRFAPF